MERPSTHKVTAPPAFVKKIIATARSLEWVFNRAWIICMIVQECKGIWVKILARLKAAAMRAAVRSPLSPQIAVAAVFTHLVAGINPFFPITLEK